MAESIARRTRRRSAGEGTVYRRNDRPGWRGAVTWTEADGTDPAASSRHATPGEARDKLDALRRELRLGTLTPGRGATVAEYLAAWIERDRVCVRPSTWRSREMHCPAAISCRRLVRLHWPA